MTARSDELKKIIKEAKELDAATAARVLVVIADIVEGVEKEVAEFKQQARETNVTVQKSFIDTHTAIQDLRKETMDYRADREKSELEEKTIAYSIAKRRANNLSTQEKIEVKEVVKDEMNKDTIDVRGIKLPKKQFTYVMLGVIALLAMLIVFLPDAVSGLLIRLGGLIGGAP